MEDTTTPTGASDPEPLTPVNQAVQYAGGPLSLEDVAGMIRGAADYCSIPLTDHQARQLASGPLAAAKAHGHYRYGRGYAHGRGDWEREGTLPNIDDPREEQVDLLAKAIREASDGAPMSAEEWAEVLFDSGVRAIDPTGAVRPWSWRRTTEGWTSSPAPDPMRCITCGAAEVDGQVQHLPDCSDRVLTSGPVPQWKRDVESAEEARRSEAADELHRLTQEQLTEEFDTSSSASRQHFIDTGRYLTHAEVAEYATPAEPPDLMAALRASVTRPTTPTDRLRRAEEAARDEQHDGYLSTETANELAAAREAVQAEALAHGQIVDDVTLDAQRDQQ